MEAALHGDDPAAFDLSEDHAALVALDRRNGESGNVLVFDDEPGVDLIGEIAQSGSEYNPHFGREILGPGSDVADRMNAAVFLISSNIFF